MTDDELARGLVECGVGSECNGYYSPEGSGFLSETQNTPAWFDRSNMLPDKFVRDPRVAMAAIKLVVIHDQLDVVTYYDEKTKSYKVCIESYDGMSPETKNESLELAINTACYEALK